jgi:cytochrome oxidase assembly protein ShyY1
MDHQISQRRTSGFAVFTLVMATLFVELSVWQLQRRVETKATLLR